MFCSICCDTINQSQSSERSDLGILFHKTRRQKHIMCNDCTIIYLKIEFKKLFQLPRFLRSCFIQCPGNYYSHKRNICKKNVNIAKLDLSFSEDLQNEKNKLLSLSQNLNLLSCPSCDKIILCKEQKNICYYCTTEFCKFCLKIPYHKDDECSDNFKEFQLLFDQGVLQKCPFCGVVINKTEGCNKIFCIRCDNTFCWLCNEGNIDYDHFNSLTGKCANKLWK